MCLLNSVGAMGSPSNSFWLAVVLVPLWLFLLLVPLTVIASLVSPAGIFCYV